MLVHLAIADVVNDVHAWRFWMEREELAEKAIASVRSTASALATLIETGWLTVLTPGGGRGRPTEYRYHLGGNRATVAPFAGETVQPATTNRATKRARSTSIPRQQNSDLRIVDGVSADGGFSEWYAGYPRRIDKARARKVFHARLAEGATLGALTMARDAYAASVLDSEPKYIKHPSTFLAREGPWTEYLAGDPNMPAHDPGTIAQQLARQSWGPKGESNGRRRATG